MKLRVVLQNQLSENLSCLKDVNKQKDTIWICELKQEYVHVKHHKKKIVFLISALRHFVNKLKKNGYKVFHLKLDDAQNSGSLESGVINWTAVNKPSSIIFTWPADERTLQTIKNIEKKVGIPVEIREDNLFLNPIAEFQDWAKNKKQYRLEFFYREMRKKFDILMDGASPKGGKWNFDQSNRKPLPDKLNLPEPFQVEKDSITKEVISLVEKHFSSHFGDILPFHFAVSREDALKALHIFIEQRLSHFGMYQDAMTTKSPWLFHSHLSFYLNCSLLEPLECIEAAQKAYENNQASIESVEGFIRQILGWREFLRGVYWTHMPNYKNANYLDAVHDLPAFYWDGNTKMNCMHHCVTDTKEYAYAHHIQRLMVLGNFALILGVEPEQLNEWFLIVYCDAFEWVELPNVSGMALFADGGLLSSKPYAATGNYINKMSNYCKSCHYSVELKNGSQACPFNYLYWDFFIRHHDKLAKNPRLFMVYKNLKKMSSERINNIKEDAKKFRKSSQ